MIKIWYIKILLSSLFFSGGRASFLRLYCRGTLITLLAEISSCRKCGKPCVSTFIRTQKNISPRLSVIRLQWGWRLEGWSNTAARLAGWRRVTPQMWFCTWWTGRTACLFRTVPVALTCAPQLRNEGISVCCYIITYVHHHLSWATSRKEGMAWYSGIDPCLSMLSFLHTADPSFF